MKVPDNIINGKKGPFKLKQQFQLKRLNNVLYKVFKIRLPCSYFF